MKIKVPFETNDDDEDWLSGVMIEDVIIKYMQRRVDGFINRGDYVVPYSDGNIIDTRTGRINPSPNYTVAVDGLHGILPNEYQIRTGKLFKEQVSSRLVPLRDHCRFFDLKDSI